VAVILNSVKEIHFYVLCSEKLNYTNYVENVLPVKSALSSFLEFAILVIYGSPFSVKI